MYDIKQIIYYIESMHISILSVLAEEREKWGWMFGFGSGLGNGVDLLEYL